MARPVKATSKSKGKRNDRSQSERFIETARAHGADESGKSFEAAFKKLVPSKVRPRTAKTPPQRMMGKEELIERYGGFFAGESMAERKKRFAEIDKLESDFKSGKIKVNDLERVQRRLCELKGIDFDSYDDPND
jgi:hypothetical protein